MNNAKLKPGQLVTHNGHIFRVKRLIFKCDQRCNLQESQACIKYTLNGKLKLNNCLKLVK